MSDVNLRKELYLGIRSIYVGLAVLTYVGFADSVTTRLAIMMVFLTLILSFVNEYAVVRHSVNLAKSTRSKALTLLGFMLAGATLSLYTLHVVNTYIWVEPMEDSAVTYLYWTTAYMYGISFFIAAAVARRSLEAHKVF